MHPLVCIGKPFEDIINTAKTFNVDLIIIATHGGAGWIRTLLGSTAEWVVRHAPCPVLVVRQVEHEVVQRDQPSTEAEIL